MAKDTGTKVVASNRSARHDYSILDTVEAGMVLRGSEVKSLRDAQVQIRESFVRIENGEAWLIGMHIAPWGTTGTHDAVEPDRKRKLLLHREQIQKWKMRVDLERLSIVPLSVYFSNGNAKIELGLAKGRTKGDRRQAIAEREAKREADVAMGRARKRGDE